MQVALACRHVHAQDDNVQLLKWWQATGYKKSPNLRVYKGASSIPKGLLDGIMARGSNQAGQRHLTTCTRTYTAV